MKKNLAILMTLIAGGAAAAFVLGRVAPDPVVENTVSERTASETSPAIPVETLRADDPAPQPPGAVQGPDALARLDAERLRVAEALSAAEAEAARLGQALAEAERRATAEAEGRAAAEARLLTRTEAAPEAEALAAGSAERDAELARLSALLVERDVELERLSAEVAAQATEIARLSAEMAARDTEIARILDAAKIAAGPFAPILARSSEAPAEVPAAVPAESSPLPALDAAKSPPAARSPILSEVPVAAVQFDMGSAGLSPGGAMRAAAAAAALAAMDANAIRLTGHSDTVGSASANLALSRARAQSVADALVAAGIPRGRIEVVALGEDAGMLPVPTERGVPEPLNRSVGVWAVGPRLAMN